MGTLADRIGTSYAREVGRPRRNGGRLFKYRLYLKDGSAVGEGTYAQDINAGELIWAAGTRQFRVVAVVPVDDDEGSDSVGLLKLAAA